MKPGEWRVGNASTSKNMLILKTLLTIISILDLEP